MQYILGLRRVLMSAPYCGCFFWACLMWISQWTITQKSWGISSPKWGRPQGLPLKKTMRKGGLRAEVIFRVSLKWNLYFIPHPPKYCSLLSDLEGSWETWSVWVITHLFPGRLQRLILQSDVALDSEAHPPADTPLFCYRLYMWINDMLNIKII